MAFVTDFEKILLYRHLGDLDKNCPNREMVVWETSKPGKITICDAPEQLRLAALAKANKS